MEICSSYLIRRTLLPTETTRSTSTGSSRGSKESRICLHLSYCARPQSRDYCSPFSRGPLLLPTQRGRITTPSGSHCSADCLRSTRCPHSTTTGWKTAAWEQECSDFASNSLRKVSICWTWGNLTRLPTTSSPWTPCRSSWSWRETTTLPPLSVGRRKNWNNTQEIEELFSCPSSSAL